MSGAIVEVRNQAELDKAVKAVDIPNLIGDAAVTFNVTLASLVQCSGSSQPRIVCYDSSQPRIVCSGSSQPRIVCSGSSQPRIVCSDSSQPRIECSGSSVAVVDGAARAKITKKSATATLVKNAAARPWKTPKEWCAYYSVKVVRGVAVLFKAVESDWKGDPKSSISYEPGLSPAAPDWDGGKAECGGGLHFSPRPTMALRFCSGADHFLACKVRIADMAVHPKGQYPEKCKAPKVCAPCVEVDIDGEPIGGAK